MDSISGKIEFQSFLCLFLILWTASYLTIEKGEKRDKGDSYG